MMVKVLSDERRRRMILDVLTPGASVQKVAESYGINRNTLYNHINRAVRDPEGRWREAQEEASFRPKVYELLR
jgi:transposase-like protein